MLNVLLYGWLSLFHSVLDKGEVMDNEQTHDYSDKGDYSCSHCNDTKVIKYKPIEVLHDRSYVPWETRICNYCE